MIRTPFWVRYERWEYTRLQRVRELMDQHYTFDKERVLSTYKKEKKEKFIWSYVIKPVRQGY